MEPDNHPLRLLEEIDVEKHFLTCSNCFLSKCSYRHIFKTSSSRETVASIFGRFDVFRDWSNLRFGAGKIKRAIKSISDQNHSCMLGPYRLPEDGIVIAQSGGQAVVIASKRHEKVLKVESHIHAARYHEIACNTWKSFRNAGLARYVPELLSSGEATQGVYFTESELCVNSPPYLRRLHWPKVLETRIFPILQVFHERNGVQIADGVTWAERIDGKLGSRQLPSTMQLPWSNALDQLSRNPSVKMPLCMISGDLQPQNIHLNPAQIKILDWSNMSDSALIIDVFSNIFYPAVANHDSPGGAAFWRFLSGAIDISATSRAMQEIAAIWQRWMKSWLGIESDERLLRLQLRGMCWDWLLTMTHPWKADGSLWRGVRFPEIFLDS